MLFFSDLVKGLKIEKGNLSKLLRKLNILGTLVRGRRNQLSKIYNDEEIEKILEYRKGISHNLVKTNLGFKVKTSKKNIITSEGNCAICVLNRFTFKK